MDKTYAPVALFTYNRPEHTKKTLESLSKNNLAQDSTLYVFCDGPKKYAPKDERERITEVNKIVRSKNWCREVIVINEPTNKGLANSIIDGVTTVVKKHGKIIVLEDDLVTSRGFLKYMNDALEIYCNDKKVMCISAYQYPVKNKLPETFFHSHISSWGWATWERAWDLLDTNPKKLLDKISKSGNLKRFDLNGAYAFSDQLRRNIDGSLYTWAIKWSATVYLNNGLVLNPGKSLVANIGFDNTGQNSGSENSYKVRSLARRIKTDRIGLNINFSASEEIESFFRKRQEELNKNKISILSVLKRKVGKLLNTRGD